MRGSCSPARRSAPAGGGLVRSVRNRADGYLYGCLSLDGRQQMEEYRAYIVGPDGHVLERVDLRCNDVPKHLR
jgi:hypothetical protein